MNKQEQARKLDAIAARCNADEAFKQRLMANPMATLKAEGIHLSDELSDDELNKIAAGDRKKSFDEQREQALHDIKVDTSLQGTIRRNV